MPFRRARSRMRSATPPWPLARTLGAALRLLASYCRATARWRLSFAAMGSGAQGQAQRRRFGPRESRRGGRAFCREIQEVQRERGVFREARAQFFGPLGQEGGRLLVLGDDPGGRGVLPYLQGHRDRSQAFGVEGD